MAKGVDQTNSGVKKKGSWDDIADFSRKVCEVVDNRGQYEERDFEEWRPKKDERKKDMKQKTVEKASINEKEMEKSSEGVKKDLKKASATATEAGKKAAKKQNPKKELVETSEEAAKPFYAEIAKYFRFFEKKIYSIISTPLNPYYFDAKDLSASLRSSGDVYEMEVNISDENLRKSVQEEFMDGI